VPDLASDRTPLQKTTYGTRAVRAHARGSRQKTRSRKLHRNNVHASLRERNCSVRRFLKLVTMKPVGESTTLSLPRRPKTWLDREDALVAHILIDQSTNRQRKIRSED